MNCPRVYTFHILKDPGGIRGEKSFSKCLLSACGMFKRVLFRSGQSFQFRVEYLQSASKGLNPRLQAIDNHSCSTWMQQTTVVMRNRMGESFEFGQNRIKVKSVF